MSFLSIPDKSAIVSAYALAFMFCLPFAGTIELFAFLAIGQLLFVALVFFCFRKDANSLLKQLQQQYPKTSLIFIGWAISVALSSIPVLIADTNIWPKIAVVIRILYIITEIAFCVSLMRFVLITKTPYIHILLSFCLGMTGIIFIHFAVLYWGPEYPSEVWLKSPYLSPNMRDIGDLATAAIAILGAMYCFSRQPVQSAALLALLTIIWAYLLWSGGRTAIASALVVNILTLFICRFYGQIALQKIALSALALLTAYFLCDTFSIYDWNGIVRYSSEWQQNNPEFNGDASSGRIEMWTWSIEVFSRQPWLGYGPYGFYFLPERFAHQFYHDHPHNLLVQCLIEWGIVGTTLFAGFLIGLATEGIKQLKTMITSRNSGFIAAASVVLMLTLGSLTGGSYWDYQPVIILAVAFAGFPFLQTLIISKDGH